MSRDLSLYFDDILDAIAYIREFTSGMAFHAFRSASDGDSCATPSAGSSPALIETLEDCIDMGKARDLAL